jgi:glycosyltransferase involved in cell wall biosynthesis
MRKIHIGIHVYTEPDRLGATLAGLRAQMPFAYELLLLPDGPDTVTLAALATLHEIPQSKTVEPCGAAACFNRLVSGPKSDIYVFLESGTLVGANWLEHLLVALDSDPRNGLAGPSTNYAWNDQGVFREGGSTPAEIERTAQQAFAQFGYQVRTLEPLYSLADFCYVVRREVIEAIGLADEGYGLGPCWEMDYNIRAARAGWRGVWACAAYVHRAPFTPRRGREEALRFEASKHRYQDKFCGARLRGEKKDYRLHCRGDSCPNFAPQELIRIKHTSASALAHPGDGLESGITTSIDGEDKYRDATAQLLDDQSPNRSAAPSHVSAIQQSDPLVTCIMPTYNRRSYIPQAIRCFLRQDYPNCELLIVDDGTDRISDCVPDNARIRYIRLDRKLSIGAKRNLACSQAAGELIVHWDDDDWYPSHRVSSQVRALLDRPADMCGSSRVLYYKVATDEVWEYRYAAQSNPWVAGNTLAYRKGFWERNKFPDIQVGEDSRFVWSGAGKAIADLADSTLCVASVHPRNTSRKETAGAYWYPQPTSRVHELLGDEMYIYRSAEVAADLKSCPLVSCIMPTYNRRSFITLSLRYFCYQDYPNRELVIVDDGEDPVGDLVQDLPNVRYIRLPHRVSIGTKRNLACQHAGGDVIAHWDDDDWYAPDRLRYQVAPILMNEADVTGLENAYVLALPTGEFWTIKSDLHRRMFTGNVHGGTLVYRKSILAGLQYPEISLAEDAWLLDRAVRGGKRLVRLTNPGLFVYVRHGRNAWRFQTGRFLDPLGWERIQSPVTFPTDVLVSYVEAAAPSRAI